MLTAYLAATVALFDLFATLLWKAELCERLARQFPEAAETYDTLAADYYAQALTLVE